MTSTRRTWSAGLLMYRLTDAGPEVFLVHPGGPFWAKKDLGAWSIPKGEHDAEESSFEAAKREFAEETGLSAEGVFMPLGTVIQRGGKVVSAWAFRGDCRPDELVSNLCSIEWPPRSGRRIEFPEVDRGAWFSLGEARRRLLESQTPFLDRLQAGLERLSSAP